MISSRPSLLGTRAKRTLAAVFGFLGLAGLGFIVVGFLIARPWVAERSIRIEAPPAQVFVYLDSLSLWDEWTVWGEVTSTFEGPGRGQGARRTWDDPTFGSGVFVVDESQPPETLEYTVEVQGGRLTITGAFQLTPAGDGTRVTWREVGDFGRNPMLGYAVGSMGRAQGAEMDRNLERLKALLESDG